MGATEISGDGNYLRTLSLGDQTRGTVSTDVTTGSRLSDEQMLDGQGISVYTNQNVEVEDMAVTQSHESKFIQ